MSDGAERFKLYSFYAFGICGFIVFLFIGEYTFNITRGFEQTIFLGFVGLFLLTAVVDVILLILSSVHLFQMAKNLTITDHKWFEEQKNR